jgi:hypothetical protein
MRNLENNNENNFGLIGQENGKRGKKPFSQGFLMSFITACNY